MVMLTLTDKRAVGEHLKMNRSNPGSSGNAAPSGSRGEGGLSRDPISLALKRLHETVVAEDVPDDFLNLLAEIDRKLESEGRSE
jgi:Anti-sigma factor NepR